jgi:hypothetical protein
MCFCGGLQFQDLNAEKIPASTGLQAFKSQYFKGYKHISISNK